MTEKGAQEIRVLVIDDSAFNRQTITSILETQPGIRVVARAGDGDEGLKQVFTHGPDVITLDLEMPKMDGFTFLRILMSRRPTPVIVISSYARRENVFKALELGALDFIAKPTQKISPELREIEKELIEKVQLVTKLRVVAPAAAGRGPGSAPLPGVPSPSASPLPGAPPRVVVIGASTGGPPALVQIMAALEAELPAAVLIAQHMPAKFTTAFAERLDRGSAFEVREAQGGEVLRCGLALVAPGGALTTLARDEHGALRVKVDPPGPDERFLPSIDRLFESAAACVPGPELTGVVLTGMGGDGKRGVVAIRDRGGRVVAESNDTAVISSMPEEAVKTGAVAEVLPLGKIAGAIARLVRSDRL